MRGSDRAGALRTKIVKVADALGGPVHELREYPCHVPRPFGKSCANCCGSLSSLDNVCGLFCRTTSLSGVIAQLDPKIGSLQASARQLTRLAVRQRWRSTTIPAGDLPIQYRGKYSRHSCGQAL